MGSSPAGKKSPGKPPDSADMGIWKDLSWEDRKLNLVNVSLFLHTSLVRLQILSRPAWKNFCK